MCEIHKLLNKGDLIYIEGRLNYRKKVDTAIFTEIVAKNLRILNRKNYLTSEHTKDSLEVIEDDFDGFTSGDE